MNDAGILNEPLSTPNSPWWTREVEDVLLNLKTDRDQGLPSDEARVRLERYGYNRLPEAERISPLKIFFNQFASLIVWILIGAGFIAGILGEWIDAWAITVIVFLNAILGFIQEYQAERSLDALKKLSNPKSKVIRDGASHIADSNFLVPGDLVVLEAGDRIPADGRVIYSVQLSAQEASLTGESTAVHGTEGAKKILLGPEEYGFHGDGGCERKRPDGCHADRS